MWNVKNGSLKLSCPHSSSEYVLSCDVSQDDMRLLSASVDRYAKVTKKSVNFSTNDFSELCEIDFIIKCHIVSTSHNLGPIFPSTIPVLGWYM